MVCPRYVQGKTVVNKESVVRHGGNTTLSLPVIMAARRRLMSPMPSFSIRFGRYLEPPQRELLEEPFQAKRPPTAHQPSRPAARVRVSLAPPLSYSPNCE